MKKIIWTIPWFVVFSLCGCSPDEHSKSSDSVTPIQSKKAYSLVAVEMEMIRKKWKANEEYDSTEMYHRCFYAGRSVVQEFGILCDKPEFHLYARNVLHWLLENDEWSEVFDFVVGRLKKNPQSPEATVLLYVIATEKIEKIEGAKEVIALVSPFLDDETYVMTIKGNPYGERKMRVADYAAYVLQVLSGNDFGSNKLWGGGDDAIKKAKKWIAESRSIQKK